MDYLNHGTCSGACTDDHRFKFGNLDIDSPEADYPPSEPKREDYTWWTYPDYDPIPCIDNYWEDCMYAFGCTECKKGYPVGDPDTHYSQEYKCRCYSYTPYPSGDDEEAICPSF